MYGVWVIILAALDHQYCTKYRVSWSMALVLEPVLHALQVQIAKASEQVLLEELSKLRAQNSELQETRASMASLEQVSLRMKSETGVLVSTREYCVDFECVLYF